MPASFRSDPIFMVDIQGLQINNVSDPKAISFEFEEAGDAGRVMTFKIEDFAFRLLDDPKLVEGTPVKWRYGYLNDLSPLFKGTIGEVQPDFGDGGCILTVSSFDGVVNFLNQEHRIGYYKDGKGIKASEIVEKIAAKYGMTAVVEPTKGVVRDRIQGGMTDWEFIQKSLAPYAQADNPAKRGVYRLSFSADMKQLIWKPVPMAGPIKKVYVYYIENQNPEIIRFAPRSKPHDPSSRGLNGVVTAQDGHGGTPVYRLSDDASTGNLGGSGQGQLTPYGMSMVTGAGLPADVGGRTVQNPDLDDPRSTPEDEPAAADAQHHLDQINAIEADLEVILEPQLRRGHNIGMRNFGLKFSGRYLIDSMRVIIDEGGGRTELGLKRNAVENPAMANAGTSAKRQQGDEDTEPNATAVSVVSGEE